MPIHRHRSETNYTILPNELLRDPQMSCRDRGLLVFILSLPADWDVSINGLTSMLPDGRTFVTASLKRLRALGYVVKDQIRDEQGRIKGTDWHVFDSTKAAADSPYSEPAPDPDPPYPENPDTDSTDLEKQTQTKKRLNKEKTEQRNRKRRPRDFDEVVAYFASRNAPESEARKWLDRQEACGWVFGKGHLPVKDWKASARTWIGNITHYSHSNGQSHAPRTTAAERSAGITLESVAGSANRLVALLDDADG